MPWVVRYRVPDGKRVPIEIMVQARQQLKVPPRKYRTISYTDAVLDVIAHVTMDTADGARYALHDVTPRETQRRICAHVVRSVGGQHKMVGVLRYWFPQRDYDDYSLKLVQTQRGDHNVQRYFDLIRDRFDFYVNTTRSTELRNLVLRHVSNCRHQRLRPGTYRLYDEDDVAALEGILQQVPFAVWEKEQEGDG